MNASVPDLRQYQRESIDWLEAHQRSIFASDPGTGKTRVLIERKTSDSGPTLVVCCLRSAMRTWRNELTRWKPDVPFVVYHGEPSTRKGDEMVDRVNIVRREGGYVITTPRMLEELPVRWQTIIFDEAHILKNHRTKLYKIAQGGRSQELYWVTGSPLVNSPADLWSALHIIEPRKFTSYWRWVSQNCHLEKSVFGTKVYGVRNPGYTREILAPYFFAKHKEDVQAELPAKNRYGLYAELTKQQRRLYKEFRSQLYAVLDNGHHILTMNSLAEMTRLRQLLISPELLPDWEGPATSGAIETLIAFLEQDIDLGHQVIIFTPFTSGIHSINRAIRRLPSVVSGIVHGAMSAGAIGQSIDDFQNGHSNVLLSTIRSAASWDGYAARVAYFVGYDFTPAFNFQAEDRLHRLGQKNSVDIRYIINEDTFDEHILEILDGKSIWEQALFGQRSL